jgi:hypothetical protein
LIWRVSQARDEAVRRFWSLSRAIRVVLF